MTRAAFLLAAALIAAPLAGAQQGAARLLAGGERQARARQGSGDRRAMARRGEWDNSEQWHFAREQNVAEELRNPRTHHIFSKVDLPVLGANVFYVQQYLDDEPSKIYAPQRFYVFTADYAKQAVRLDILTPKDSEAVKDAHLDPAKLAGRHHGLGRGRRLAARSSGGAGSDHHFNGSMAKGACKVIPSGWAKPSS